VVRTSAVEARFARRVAPNNNLITEVFELQLLAESRSSTLGNNWHRRFKCPLSRLEVMVIVTQMEHCFTSRTPLHTLNGAHMLTRMKATRIRLHLVHGTWAKGLRGTTRAWSEPGDTAYERLRTKLPASSQLESFTWSGRNSMAARTKAANDLQQHLRQSLREHPKDCHIVLAHSHGGTVANQAVSCSDLDGAIRGLICLATPFAYLVSPSLGRLQTGILALTSVLYAIYWAALLAWMPWIPEFLGITVFSAFVAVKSLVAFCLVAIIAKTQFETKTATLRQCGPKKTSVFLLRGSRDEASLLLTEAQIFDAICAAFARLNDVTQPTIRRPLTWVGYAMVYASCSALGIYAAIRLAPALMPHVGGDAVAIMGIFVYGPAVAGWVYLLGYAVIAVGAGHLNILQWLSSVVEVEAAPPNTSCHIYVFSALGTSGLRHCLYEDGEVLGHVAELATSIANP